MNHLLKAFEDMPNYYTKTIKHLNLKVTEYSNEIDGLNGKLNDCNENLKGVRGQVKVLQQELEECRNTENTSTSMIQRLINWIQGLSQKKIG